MIDDTKVQLSIAVAARAWRTSPCPFFTLRTHPPHYSAAGAGPLPLRGSILPLSHSFYALKPLKEVIGRAYGTCHLLYTTAAATVFILVVIALLVRQS